MTEFDPIDITTWPEDDDPESLAGDPVEDLNALRGPELSDLGMIPDGV
jgi:hypothetical protein